MDAFEELVAQILQAEGYWVERSVKITLTPAEKRALGNPSMPRPEIDLIAYRPAAGELLAVECKSYLDSGGVHASDLMPGGRHPERYKMFVRDGLREKVLQRLSEQLAEQGMVAPGTKAQLALIYGHASPASEARLKDWFAEHGWLLRGPVWLRDRLAAMATRSYDNQIASVVAKLLLPRRIASITTEPLPDPVEEAA